MAACLIALLQVLACEMEGAAQPLGLAVRVPVRPLVVTAHVSKAEQVRRVLAARTAALAARPASSLRYRIFNQGCVL